MARKKRSKTTKRSSIVGRRGIYLLPNLFTTAAMFAGFFAMIAAMNGEFRAAGVAVLVAMVLDGVDGRVARLTGTESEFGREYDSLSDLVSFGLAPAMIVYNWGMGVLGDEPWWWWAQISWLVAFFFAVAAALRLARFNTRAATTDRRYFQGLPSPSAAACIAFGAWLLAQLELHTAFMLPVVYLLAVAIAALMVSNFSYYSFKDLDLAGGRVPFTYAILIPSSFILIALAPAPVLFAGFFLYALSGPVLALWRRYYRRGVTSRGSDADAKEGRGD
ncbi:CDP-diacylglycerol--serine O-phosphatidyltransferase [Natronospira bacteriovora]|uniref:CDP-diacylglycerol--serine O-phosphatidyltransferase n=1 Tax=Natronospira bacteriovora TaxID=3069753 RepID=A0ABU0W606_9GAMM|nr:CDP-diacylglycerol--serine O-phosphatidyltransferase [Natronospira sp. AB-CW4]MDQ2069436.1 CDP-diacylglycerol--serine O-phosphatidyltransferase [Natronospira sp. AB-CW4]